MGKKLATVYDFELLPKIMRSDLGTQTNMNQNSGDIDNQLTAQLCQSPFLLQLGDATELPSG